MKLHLNRRKTVDVATLRSASRTLLAHIDFNYRLHGKSCLDRRSGAVTWVGEGAPIAWVSPNGRVWESAKTGAKEIKLPGRKVSK